MGIQNLARNSSEYLVAIGWDVDKEGMNKAQKLVGGLFNKFDSWAKNAGKGYIQAAEMAVAAITAVTRYTVGLINTTAELDMQNKMLAKQYHVNENTMMAYTEALQQFNDIGITGYEDLFWASGETIKQYKELIKLGQDMQAPEGLKKTNVLLRDITFQLKRFNVIRKNAFRWITYYIGEAMGPQLTKYRNQLKELIDKVAVNMPKITKYIAKLLTIVLRLSLAIGTLAVNIGKILFDIFQMFDKLPGIVKLLPLIGLAMLGPLGQVFSLLTAIGLLFDDYITWKNGGEALLNWKEFDETIGKLKDTWEDFKTTFHLDEVFPQAGVAILQTVVDLFSGLALAINFVIGVVSTLLGLFNDLTVTIKNTFQSLSDFVPDLSGLGKDIGVNALSSILGILPGSSIFGRVFDNMEGSGTKQTGSGRGIVINHTDNSQNYVQKAEDISNLQNKKINNVLNANLLSRTPAI